MNDLTPDDFDTGAQHPAPETQKHTLSDPDAPEPKENRHDLDAKIIAELAAMDPLAYGRIAKAKAAELGLDGVTFLNQAVKADRSAAKKQADARAKDEADAIKKQEKDEANAKKQKEADARKQAANEKKAAVEAKARDKQAKADAKERERARKLADAAAKKKARPVLQIDDEDDRPAGWTPPQSPLPEIIVEGGERPAIADAGLAVMRSLGKLPTLRATRQRLGRIDAVAEPHALHRRYHDALVSQDTGNPRLRT